MDGWLCCAVLCCPPRVLRRAAVRCPCRAVRCKVLPAPLDNPPARPSRVPDSGCPQLLAASHSPPHQPPRACTDVPCRALPLASSFNPSLNQHSLPLSRIQGTQLSAIAIPIPRPFVRPSHPIHHSCSSPPSQATPDRGRPAMPASASTQLMSLAHGPPPVPCEPTPASRHCFDGAETTPPPSPTEGTASAASNAWLPGSSREAC